MNSFHHRSNSAKTIDINNKIIKSYLSKNVKNHLNFNKQKKKHNNNNNSITKEIVSKTTMDFYTKKNVIKNNYNKMSPSSLYKSKNKAKYGNFFIFGKRELAFHNSIREGRKVFKYHQSSIDDEDDNKVRLKKVNSLYLTEALFKRNRTTLPLIDRDRSIIEDIDTSNLNINLNEKTKNKNDITILKNIILKKEKEKEKKNIQEYLASKKLIKKNDIIVNNVKEKSLNNYINTMKEYLIDKYTLDIKNEKYRVINETNKNKIENLNDTIRDLNSNGKLFAEEFYPCFNEYIKKFDKQREIEKQRDFIFINQIYLLSKRISNLRNKINKCQNERDHLMQFVFLQICIKEKKLNLPEYYKDILANNYTKNEIKEKYGKGLNEKEIDRIFDYKNNLDFNEEEIISEKMKRLENDNIELMNNYNKIREKIFQLKKYKKKAEEEIKKDTFNDIDSLILIKEKVLENIIKKNKKLTQDKLFLIKTKAKKVKKRSKLFYKMELLFKNINIYKKFDFSEKNNVEKIKGEITEEIQMIEMFKKIERIISYVLEKNRQYLNNNKEQMQTLKNLLAKKKKIEKTNEQKRNIVLKFEKERKKIFEKNNKILFLQRRKLSIFNVMDKKLIRKSRSQQKIKIDKIDDYMHDLLYEN